MGSISNARREDLVRHGDGEINSGKAPRVHGDGKEDDVDEGSGQEVVLLGGIIGQLLSLQTGGHQV